MNPKYIISILVLTALPLAAGDRKVPEDPVVQLGYALAGNKEITLDEAIDIARANDPNLSLQRANSDFEGAIARESSGVFDRAIELSLDFEWLRAELLPSTQRQVGSQREIQFQFATIFQQVADDLQRELDGDPNFDTIPCSDVLQEGTEIVIQLPDGTFVTITCTPVDAPGALGDIIDTLANSENTDPALREQLNNLSDLSTATARAGIQQIIDILNLNAKANREQLRRLGVAPFMEEKIGFTFFSGYRYWLRNGMSWAPRFGLQSTQERFVAKSENPNYGGKGKTKFLAAAGLEVNWPLARGGGLGVADALERSAALNYKASLSGTKHAETSTIQRTAAAYWSLLAAQKRVEASVEVVERAEQQFEIGNAMVKGGEVPAADLNQIRGLVANAKQNYSSSRVSVRRAQQSLARTIGLIVEGPEDLPIATGELPPVIAPETLRSIDPSKLYAEALTKRADLAEAFTRIDAAKTLSFAARKEMRPKVDLSFFIGYQSKHNAYSIQEGIGDVLFGSWFGPSAGLTLTVELPYKNLTAIGQYRRSVALQHQSEVQARDLQRTTEARIATLWGSLIEAAEIIVRYENAERMYLQALADVREKFEKGEGTALDEIYTQEQLASAQLTLVSARASWASLLTQLRFETGTIAEPEFGDTMMDLLSIPPNIAQTNRSNDDAAARLAADLNKSNIHRLPTTWPTTR